MGKRRRGEHDQEHGMTEAIGKARPFASTDKDESRNRGQVCEMVKDPQDAVTVQIVVGTYEKVLHGITATLLASAQFPTENRGEVEFADTFLLSTHTSAIRCLALSPSPTHNSNKLLLATGGSDQFINLYQLSTESQVQSSLNATTLPALSGRPVLPNPGNKELGSLQHHGGGITDLHFPTRSKLISASEDCTIAITRTRDWTTLSTIKTPMPKAQGRPSGDTAPLGGTPSGVNGVAIHPSMKLMVSVSKGERSMRLWNLVTGKKAGVLNFGKHLLRELGEGKWASGEGRRVRWNSIGEEFVVAFERACMVYGLDSKVKCVLFPQPSTKIHQVRYVALEPGEEDTKEALVISTEDGQLLFYFTPEVGIENHQQPSDISSLLTYPVARLGGTAEGLVGRIKDFEILRSPAKEELLLVTGGSDGAIRLWMVAVAELSSLMPSRAKSTKTKAPADDVQTNGTGYQIPKVGHLLGIYEAGNRITCLAAFVTTNPRSKEIDTFRNGDASIFQG